MVTFEFPRGRGLRRPPVGRRRAVRAAPHPRCLGGRCSGAPRYGCEPGRDGARWSLSPARNNLEPLLKAARCQNVLLFNLQFQYDASMEVQDLGSIRVLWGCLVGMTVVTLFRLTSVVVLAVVSMVVSLFIWLEIPESHRGSPAHAKRRRRRMWRPRYTYDVAQRWITPHRVLGCQVKSSHYINNRQPI